MEVIRVGNVIINLAAIAICVLVPEKDELNIFLVNGYAHTFRGDDAKNVWHHIEMGTNDLGGG